MLALVLSTYVCMALTHSKVWINRVRLPILLVVRLTGKMNNSLSPFAPDNLALRGGFGRPCPASACSFSIRRLNLVPTRGLLPISAAASIYLLKQPYAIGSVPCLSGDPFAYRWHSLPRFRRHRASSPQSSFSNGYCLFVTMSQLMYASLIPHLLIV